MMNKFIEFQERLYNSSEQDINFFVSFIIENGFLSTDFLQRCFFQDILNLLKYRPERCKFIIGLLKQLSQHIESKKLFWEHLVFSIIKVCQSDIDIFNQTYAFSFLYQLIKNYLIEFSFVFEKFLMFENDNEVFKNMRLLFFVWFLPEIMQYDLTYYNEKMNMLLLFSKSSDCSPLLKEFSQRVNEYQGNNLSLYNEKRDSIKIEIIDKNYNDVILPSLFSKCPFLQFCPTAAMVDSFYGSNKYFLNEENFDFNIRDNNDSPLQYFVAASGSMNNINYLKSIDVNTKGIIHIASCFHQNYLFESMIKDEICAYVENQITLNYFDESVILNECVWRLGTVLHQAAISDNIVIFKYYIDNKIDLTTVDEEGRNFIHYIAIHNSHTMIQLIADFISKNEFPSLSLSSLLNQQDENGLTPLMYASLNNSIEVAEILIQKLHVVDVNDQDISGKTALHFAAKVGATKIVKMLLMADGINKTPLENAKRTPAHFAAHFGHPSVIEELAENGSNIDSVSKNNWTPLKFAIACGHVKCTKIILDHIILNEEQRQTLFDFAENHEKPEIAKMIMK